MLDNILWRGSQSVASTLRVTKTNTLSWGFRERFHLAWPFRHAFLSTVARFLRRQCIGQQVREKTDALDAAGNTTAAVGKGFAIGSAALVSLALYGAFVTRLSNLEGTTMDGGVNILQPLTFSFLVIGAMLPYW